MNLYGERRRREARDRAEAAGESFWTEAIEGSVRYKLLYAVEALLDENYDAYDTVRRVTLRDLGLPTLSGSDNSGRDVRDAILEVGSDIVFSILEACSLYGSALAADQWSRRGPQWAEAVERFDESVRETLREHRVSFDYIDSRIIPLDSQELHVEVVEPVLRLLSGLEGWESVEKAYQDALAELHNGKAEDAITDASVALEEALALHGCTGNTLSKKMAEAKTKGVLASQDSLLAEALSKVGVWVEAERSASGDAHNAAPASREDGWLVVHIVGALLKRLATGPRMS